MKLSGRVSFFPIRMRPRIGDIILAQEDQGIYLTIEESGKEIIDHLRHHTIEQTEKHFPKKDVNGFITYLIEKGVVHKVGHRVVAEKKHISTLISLSQQQAQIFVNPYTIGIYLGIILMGWFLLFARPQLLPSIFSMYAFGFLWIIIPAFFIIHFFASLIHEFGHYVVLRAHGHKASFQIIHKWFIILPHTDISSAKMLDTTKQIQVHLAGVFSEMLLLSLTLLAIFFNIFPRIMIFSSFVIFIDLILQLSPIRKSDLTSTAQEVFGVDNLPKRMLQALKKGCIRCPNMPTHIQRATESFFPFAFLGSLLLGIFIIAYIFPGIFLYLTSAIAQLLTFTPLPFIDAILALIIGCTTLAFYTFAFLREHHFTKHDGVGILALIIHYTSLVMIIVLSAILLILFSSPAATTLGLFVGGLLFGVAFVKGVGHLEIERHGFTRDFILPVLAALSALILAYVIAFFAALLAVPFPVTIHAVAYATGMISTLAFV